MPSQPFRTQICAPLPNLMVQTDGSIGVLRIGSAAYPISLRYVFKSVAGGRQTHSESACFNASCQTRTIPCRRLDCCPIACRRQKLLLDLRVMYRSRPEMSRLLRGHSQKIQGDFSILEGNRRRLPPVSCRSPWAGYSDTPRRIRWLRSSRLWHRLVHPGHAPNPLERRHLLFKAPSGGGNSHGLIH